MLLTIFNLPPNTRYADIKALIHTKCGFNEVILDNLTQAGNNTKKVTVGLAEEEDAAILVRKINGLFMDGQQLYVETIKKKQPSSILIDHAGGTQLPTLQQPYYQQNKFQPSYQQDYSNVQQSVGHSSMPLGGRYGATQNANYGYPQQMQYQSTQQQLMAQSMVSFDQRAPLGFNNQGNNPGVWSDQNDWNIAGTASGGNQISQQSRGNSRWNNPDDSSNRPRRDGPARDHERDRGSRSFRRDAPPRDIGQSTPRRDFGRDSPSRDRGRDAPRDHRREASYRDRGRDAPSRDHDRGRDTRSASARNGPPREHGRDAPFRRSESSHAPTKRQLSPSSTLYGEHVTNSSLHVRKFSQQRDGPKPNQPWKGPQANKSAAGKADYFPPPKRTKKGKASFPANNDQAQMPIIKKPPLTPKRMEVRADTWRHQLASILAKEVMSNPEHKINGIIPQKFLTELKRAIRYRLDTLFADDHEIRMPAMVNIYRERFSTDSDTELFLEVTEDIKSNGAYLADDVEKAAPVEDNAAPGELEVNINTEKEPDQPEGTNKKIPSYPQGDKRMNKTLKKNAAMIFQDEDTLLTQMEPNLLKALNEEVDEMCALVAEEFKDDSEPEFKNFHERVTTTVVNDFKKMMKVNFAKRILNIGPIMLRIFNVPKTISRGTLAPALAKYGVTSLRKSEKKKAMYFGTCDSYDIHDKLCSMEPIVVEGSTVLIKPFHLTGKNERMSNQKINMHRKKILASFKNTGEDPIYQLDELDEEIDEEIINLNTDYDKNASQNANRNQDGNENQNGNENQDGNENPDDNKNQDGDESLEIIELEKDVPETIELVDDEEDFSEKLEPNEPQESIENDSAENTEIAEAVDDKTESNTEGSHEHVSEDIEDSNEPSKVEEEKSNKVDGTEMIDDKPKEINENDIVIPSAADLDFAADIDFYAGTENNEDENAFKMDDNADAEIEELSELNAEDLEDFKNRNSYDDIDIADLNEDDLEDW